MFLCNDHFSYVYRCGYPPLVISMYEKNKETGEVTKMPYNHYIFSKSTTWYCHSVFDEGTGLLECCGDHSILEVDDDDDDSGLISD